jgi:aryl-alcohol dehydrogenase-like predicted oxidoreductase
MTAARDTIAIPGTNLNPTRIALGTWAIGAWMWAGSSEAESIRTMHRAVDRGISHTAPVCGFGRSEEIVGEALAGIGRDKVLIATKVGLDWREGRPFRNASKVRIHREIEDSPRRLRTGLTRIRRSRRPRRRCAGKICAIGVSNFSTGRCARFAG